MLLWWFDEDRASAACGQLSDSTRASPSDAMPAISTLLVDKSTKNSTMNRIGFGRVEHQAILPGFAQTAEKGALPSEASAVTLLLP